MREALVSLVPGGSSPLSTELAAQAEAVSVMKSNLTELAMVGWGRHGHYVMKPIRKLF